LWSLKKENYSDFGNEFADALLKCNVGHSPGGGYMKTPIAVAGAASALVLSLAIAPADLARAQQAEEMEEVVVTGSRIRQDPLSETLGPDIARRLLATPAVVRWSIEYTLQFQRQFRFSARR
jgi:hypothetical protein